MPTLFETFKARAEAVSAGVRRVATRAALLADSYRAERSKDGSNADSV